MNPPFNQPTDRSTPDPVKAEAHVMTQGMMEQWIRTAAAIVKPGGSIGIIARPTSIADLAPMHLQGRFGGLIIVPVQPRPQDAAIRIVIKGSRGSRAGLVAAPGTRDASRDRKWLHRAGNCHQQWIGIAVLDH